MERLKNIEDLKNIRELLAKEIFRPDKNRLKVCCGTGCTASGSRKVVTALEEGLKGGSDIELITTGCQGLCQKGPVMRVEPYDYFYQKVTPEMAARVISTYGTGLPVRELLYRESFLEPPVERMEEVPFYKKQMRVALRNNGSIDPCTSIIPLLLVDMLRWRRYFLP